MSEIVYNESNILQDSKYKNISLTNTRFPIDTKQTIQYASLNTNFRLILIAFTQKKTVEINIPVQLLF